MYKVKIEMEFNGERTFKQVFECINDAVLFVQKCLQSERFNRRFEKVNKFKIFNEQTDLIHIVVYDIEDVEYFLTSRKGVLLQ